MHIRRHYRTLDLSRRVALRALAAFLVTFAILRVITAIIHLELFPNGPFRNLITASGLHIHHLFWGILLLMVTGFISLFLGVLLAFSLEYFKSLKSAAAKAISSDGNG